MLVMGILNTTPDSFSDGGQFDTTEKAVQRAYEMIREGVDIIDIGGESTRPGALRISDEEEQSRVLPVIKALAQESVTISVDTMRASTAQAAVEAGADIVNDVSGGKADPTMFATVAALGVPYIAMHWRGHSDVMDSMATYSNVVEEVISELMAQVDAARSAGIEQIMIDPGLGFAKKSEHNWEIIDNIDTFVATGLPVLVGGSRKRFLGGERPLDRESASIELTRRLAHTGIWAVRVHSVAPHKAVID